MFPSDPEGCLHASSSIAFVLPTGKQGSEEERRLPKSPTKSVSAWVSHTPAQDPGGHLLTAQLRRGWCHLTNAKSLNRWAFLLACGGWFKEQAMQNSCTLGPRPPCGLVQTLLCISQTCRL